MLCFSVSKTSGWKGFVTTEECAGQVLVTAPSGLNSLDLGSFGQLSAARSAFCARALARWLCHFGPADTLVWVNETGIWSSSENLPLYYRWRESLHCFSTLDSEPVHVFLAHEHNELISLLHMSLIFGWGVLAIAGDALSAFSFNHDSKLTVFCDDSARSNELAGTLNLRPPSPSS